MNNPQSAALNLPLALLRFLEPQPKAKPEQRTCGGDCSNCPCKGEAGAHGPDETDHQKDQSDAN